jgi:hypothetical protein
MLDAVEVGQEGAVTKAWPLRTAKANHLPLGEGVPDQKGACVVGGPVDERRGSDPRAHRFQAVKSTSAVEQLSPFAGKDGTSMASSLSRFERAGRVDRWVENVNADTGNRLRITEFGRALQLRIRNRIGDQEVLGERKRKGSRHAITHADSLRRLRGAGERA